MRKTFYALALLAVSALSINAQSNTCTLWTYTGCPTYYTLGSAPTGTAALAYYMQNTLASLNAINNRNILKPQPAPLITAQNMAASGSWLVTNFAVFGPAMTVYAAALKTGVGVTTDDVNVWLSAFACDPSYAGFGGVGGACEVTPFAKVALGGSLPAGVSASTPRAWSLYWYDQLVGWSAANGVTLRFGAFPVGNVVSQVTPVTSASPVTLCGFTGTITEVQAEGCVKSPIESLVTRYGTAVTALQVMEEPSAGMPSVNLTFSLSDMGLYIQHLSAAAKAVRSGILIGAAYTGTDFNTPTSGAGYYVDATAGGISANCTTSPMTTCGALNFIVWDVFQSNCDPTYPGAGSYANVLINFQGTISTPGFLTNANAVGLPVRVGQDDFPRWCQPGTTPGLANAYLHESDILYLTSGVASQWQIAIVRWAAANQLQSIAPMFLNSPLFCVSSNQAADSAYPGTALAAYCMSNLVPNFNATTEKRLSLYGPADILQGNITTTGYVGLGH